MPVVMMLIQRPSWELLKSYPKNNPLPIELNLSSNPVNKVKVVLINS